MEGKMVKISAAAPCFPIHSWFSAYTSRGPEVLSVRHTKALLLLQCRYAAVQTSRTALQEELCLLVVLSKRQASTAAEPVAKPTHGWSRRRRRAVMADHGAVPGILQS